MTKEQIAVKLHDYIPYYTGATLIYGSEKYIIKGFHYTNSHADKLTVFVLNEDGDEDALPVDENSQIVLRQLSSMTEEEALHCHLLEHPLDKNNTKGWQVIDYYSKDPFCTAKPFRYLLSCGFDLFDLIPSGLAIDATTINNQTQKP
jgi:hypothetical protein